MKIELKNVKYSPNLSQETNAFTASIYVNGKLSGFAENNGCGGNTRVSLNHATLSAAEAIIAYCKSLPPTVYPSENGSKEFKFDSNLETVVDDLLEKWIDEKYGAAAQEKKWCKKSVVFRLKGDSLDSGRTIKKQNGLYTKAIKDLIVKKYGENLSEILNEKYGEVAV